MRIGVFSDSHGHRELLLAAAAHLGALDAVIHLGDGAGDLAALGAKQACPVYCVRGNCDVASGLPAQRIETFLNKCFFITHGHVFGVKEDLWPLAQAASAAGAGMALFGHTHVPMIETQGALTLLNPGSVHTTRTCALIRIEQDQLKTEILRLD